ncbi:hypothetical protein D3C87_2075500 [compost metagenome]
MLDRQPLDFVVIDQPRDGIDPVLHRVVELSGKTDFGTMGQMPTVGQAHTQHGVTRL